MNLRILGLLLLFFSVNLSAQDIQLLDRFNGNAVVNDSVLTVWSSDPETIFLTQYLTLKNNTDKPLAVFLRKTVNYLNDSTTDYFCFGISCWPDTQVTNVADTILPGAKDSTFASHVVHVRRFDLALLPPGKSSITYTFFDSTTFQEPVEARVTIIYNLSSLGRDEVISQNPVLYPNPASGRIYLTLDIEQPQGLTIMVTDIAGKLMLNEFFVAESGITRKEINISGLRNGVYLIRVNYEGGQLLTRKLVVCN